MIQGPDFIIIGAMKCATSTLHEHLAREPGFFMSDPKEPNFFSDDAQFARGAQWYRDLFADTPRDALCGESSTHYTKLPTYPQTVLRMQQLLGSVKLIYMVRHPIDRLVSHYIHEWTERRISAPLDRAVDVHPELVAYSRYSMQLEPYLEAFGPQNILLVVFERFVADPRTELARVCRFLGQEGPVRFDPHLGAQNVSSQRLRRNRVRDALVWNPIITPLRRRFIPPGLRDRVKRLWQMKKRPVLGAQQSRRLEAIFDEDLGTLGSWLGIDLSCARFKTTVLGNVTPLFGRAPAQRVG